MLRPEILAATMMLEEDEVYNPAPAQKAEGDENSYICGKVGEHRCVITWPTLCSPEATSKTVAFLVNAFPNLRFGLLVGVAGGAPDPGFHPDLDEEPLLLGDVVVSKPDHGHSMTKSHSYLST